MTKPNSWYARRYTERFGFHIVPIEPGRKFPRSNDWGKKTLSDPDKADQFYQSHPDWNMGVALGPSRLCSLDIDCMESFRHICDCLGIDTDDLIAKSPTILGRGYRVMYRVPDGVTLPYRKVNWPSKKDPTGEKHKAAMRLAMAAKESGDTVREERIRNVAKRWAMFCVFEMRSATEGEKQRQDVLPPSIHPETGKPYAWVTQPRDEWPEPPAWMVALWEKFDSFKMQLKAMCPWTPVPDVAPEPKRGSVNKPVFKGDGLIEKYCQSCDLESELVRYGYKRVSERRYLSPHSSTGLPGVIVFPGSDSCWIHHASDPLCSEDSGHPVNAFDLFCYYDHGNDIKSAVAAAAKMLGIDSHAVRNVQQQTPIDKSIDPQAMEPTRSRDILSPLPWTTSKGKPLKHIANLQEICNRLSVQIRYNVIKKEEEILIPSESFSIDNQANASLAWLTSECSMFDFPTDKIGDFLTYIADQHLYNPVAEWITSKPWDGVPRLQSLFETVVARDEWVEPERKALKETLIKRWMISAIAGAFSPTGVSAAGVLVFQGPQYIGKTKWFKTLIPAELGLLKDGMLLRPDDKDSVKQACSYWLVELGELDSTFRRSDIAQLKAFITNDMDVLRRAYARRESTYARRTVFFGSVNPREFLHDPTGNRRYWTIECESLDHSHSIDMQQAWAEVYQLWKAGESHYLTADEMNRLNASNDEYMALNPVEERIISGLDWDQTEVHWRWAQASEVLLDSGIDRPSQSDAQHAAALLRKRNGGRFKRTNGRTVFFCPPKAFR